MDQNWCVATVTVSGIKSTHNFQIVPKVRQTDQSRGCALLNNGTLALDLTLISS